MARIGIEEREVLSSLVLNKVRSIMEIMGLDWGIWTTSGMRRLTDEIIDEFVDPDTAKIIAREATMEDCVACLRHALDLGYIGKGSTENWAKDALKTLDDLNGKV